MFALFCPAESMPCKPDTSGLYQPGFEKDSCGFGLIASIDDKPSHWLVKTSIEALARLTHRGAVAADGKSGDGCGLLLKKPDEFLRARAAELGFEFGGDHIQRSLSCAISETGFQFLQFVGLCRFRWRRAT